MLRRSSSFLLGSACAVLVASALGVFDPPARAVTTAAPAASPRTSPEVTARRTAVAPAKRRPAKKPVQKRRAVRSRPARATPPPTAPAAPTPKRVPRTFVARARALDPKDRAARQALIDAMLTAADALPPAQKNRVNACVGLAGSIQDGTGAKRRLTKCAGLLSNARP